MTTERLPGRPPASQPAATTLTWLEATASRAQALEVLGLICGELGGATGIFGTVRCGATPLRTRGVGGPFGPRGKESGGRRARAVQPLRAGWRALVEALERLAAVGCRVLGAALRWARLMCVGVGGRRRCWRAARAGLLLSRLAGRTGPPGLGGACSVWSRLLWSRTRAAAAGAPRRRAARAPAIAPEMAARPDAGRGRRRGYRPVAPPPRSHMGGALRLNPPQAATGRRRRRRRELLGCCEARRRLSGAGGSPPRARILVGVAVSPAASPDRMVRALTRAATYQHKVAPPAGRIGPQRKGGGPADGSAAAVRAARSSRWTHDGAGGGVRCLGCSEGGRRLRLACDGAAGFEEPAVVTDAYARAAGGGVPGPKASGERAPRAAVKGEPWPGGYAWFGAWRRAGSRP